jgi:stage II sporulation protein D
MDRATFLAGSLLATGGLDIWSTPSPAPVPTPAASTTQIRVVATDGSIETLDLETYLRGVVPLEASPAWPAAALQAQAIVARTYALAKKTLSRGYDVVANEGDQRYGGSASFHPSTDAAVAATRGLVVRYNSGPASVFYSACCGGHTADATALWGRAGLPYLRGVDDPACAGAPDYRWSRSIAADRVRAALADRLAADLVGGTPSDIDAGGRPRTLQLRASDGSTVALSTTEFRRRIGTDVVRSTWIREIAVDATQADRFVRIEGNGRGHGVGLCQWGAHGLALDGADAATIVAHYFPGTALTGE